MGYREAWREIRLLNSAPENRVCEKCLAGFAEPCETHTFTPAAFNTKFKFHFRHPRDVKSRMLAIFVSVFSKAELAILPG